MAQNDEEYITKEKLINADKMALENSFKNVKRHLKEN
jgi:hypothetical protein